MRACPPILQRHRPALGNPLYDWERLPPPATPGAERFRSTLRLVDRVRLDHFRGFEACWEIPGEEETAEKGRWVKGPGAGFFEALRQGLGELPIVAENLGVITPEVEELRERFGFPGMAILQFAFGGVGSAETFKPHNYVRNLVAYTGTHDNDTLVGWWTGASGQHPEGREVAAERDNCALLGTDVRNPLGLDRALLASVADTAFVPMQDVLGLGTKPMNLPGRPSATGAGAAGIGAGREAKGALLRSRSSRRHKAAAAPAPALPTPPRLRGSHDDSPA